MQLRSSGVAVNGHLPEGSPGPVERRGQVLRQLQFAPPEQEDSIRRLGEHTRLRAADVTGLRPHERPVLNQVVRARVRPRHVPLRSSARNGWSPRVMTATNAIENARILDRAGTVYFWGEIGTPASAIS